MIYDPIEFFNKLTQEERFEVLQFARAFMRVREIHLDKTYSKALREQYRELEVKLAEQQGEK